MKSIYCFVILTFLISSALFAQQDQPLYRQGLEFAQKGEFTQALDCFEKALRLDYPFTPALNSAIEICNDVEKGKISRETGRLIFSGTRLCNSGKWKNGIKEFDKAITLDPLYIPLYNARGAVLAIAGRNSEALKDFTRAIELDPLYAKAYLNRGCMLNRQLYYQEAISDFNRAIQINPRYAEAFYNRSRAYSEMGEEDKALTDLNKALVLNARYFSALYGRAVLQSRKRMYSEALNDIDSAVSLNNDFAPLFFLKAGVLEAMGKINAAVENYNLFLGKAGRDYQNLRSTAQEKIDHFKGKSVKGGVN